MGRRVSVTSVSIVLFAFVCSIVLFAGCGDSSGEEPDPSATATLLITALAGPTCPVETDPPSPDCAPRPVDGAVIVVADPDGTERARGSTGSDGTVTIEVAAGDLTLSPQPVEGLLGTADPVTVTVTDGQTLPVTVDYDTGIR